jgi:hypothetical protein
VLWYQSYRQRFFALPKTVQALSPANADVYPYRLSLPATGDVRLSIEPVSSAVPPPFSSAPTIEHTQQPFSAEIDRIVATFLSLEAVKNLRLPEETRDSVLRGIHTTTHPDVLAPAYDVAYVALQDALPRFLAQSAIVSNRSSQRFMYARGSATLTVGLAIFLVTFLCATRGPAHLSEAGIRGLRLLVFPFVVLGALDILQAAQGHCGITARLRGKTQLRPWELAAASGEEKSWWAGVMGVSDDMSDELADVENGRATVKPDSASDASIPASLSLRACRHAGRVKDQLLADLATLELPTIRRVRSARRAPAPVVISFTRATTVVADGTPTPPRTESRQSSTASLHDDFKEISLSSLGDLESVKRSSLLPATARTVAVADKMVLDPRMLATHRRIELVAFLTSLAIALVSVPPDPSSSCRSLTGLRRSSPLSASRCRLCDCNQLVSSPSVSSSLRHYAKDHVSDSDGVQ